MKARASDLQKIGRLTKRADFLRVQSMMAAGRGQKWVTPYVIIQTAPFEKTNQHGESNFLPPTQCEQKTVFCRYGVTVTKKIFPRAVDRNRVRRRYRAFFSSLVLKFPMAQDRDFVLLPRPLALKESAEKLENDLNWGLKRVLSPTFRSKEKEKEKKNA